MFNNISMVWLSSWSYLQKLHFNIKHIFQNGKSFYKRRLSLGKKKKHGCSDNQRDKANQTQLAWTECNWDVSNMIGVVLILKLSVSWLA